MALAEILSHILWVLVLRKLRGRDFIGAPSGEYLELPQQSPQLGNTG